MLQYSGMEWYLVELIVYGVGVSIYTVSPAFFVLCPLNPPKLILANHRLQFRIPERFAPGKFDIWGSSHQIFHVSILYAMYTNTIGLRQALTAYHTLDVCSIQAG